MVTKEQAGEMFLFAEILLWSLFPVISILSIKSVPALYTAAWSTGFAALFFIVLVSVRRQWKGLFVRAAYKDVLLATVFQGILFYILVFLGLQYTTAGNASIVGLMEIFFAVLILGVIWKKDPLTPRIVWGAGFMMIGAFLVLYRGSASPNVGDLLILSSTVLAPVGNVFSRRARERVSSEYLMCIRSIVSGAFLFLLAFFFAPAIALGDLRVALPFLIINGILLLGLSKVFWVEAIHRIPISKANAMSALLPAITLTIAYIILKEVPTVLQMTGLIPMIIGLFLLTAFRVGDRFQTKQHL